MYDFQLVKPSSVQDAVRALQGEDAQPLSGGQTLLPTMKARLAQPATLVALSGIDELRYVRIEGGAVVAGGAATHAMIAQAAKDAFPALASLAARIGDPAVRTRGTVGGSVANDDPSACWPAGTLGTGATITATGPDGSRRIAADDFFLGMFTTALEEGEIVTEVSFPIPDGGASYAKFIQPASRFPLVAVFVARFGDGVRVAVTGASADGVFRWTGAEAALSSDFAPKAVASVATPAPDTMISDLHGSGEYRAHLVRVMTQRAVKEIAA